MNKITEHKIGRQLTFHEINVFMGVCNIPLDTPVILEGQGDCYGFRYDDKTEKIYLLLKDEKRT